MALDGPRLPPASGRADALVVFLHGYGADGRDLIAIGREWQKLLPGAAFVSPHATELCAMSPGGRQWFQLTFRDPEERWRGVNQAGPGLDAFLEQELARQNVPPSRLVLVGFSQGAMMALHVGVRRATAPAAIVGFSGMLVGPERLAEGKRSAPPILLLHGTHDEVIPVDALLMSAEGLAKAELPCEFHLAHGLGHGIDPEGLRHGGLFIQAALKRSRAISGGASQR